jgi:hypothetical protein
VATGGDDQTARVFEAATGKEIVRVSLPAAVRFVLFTPDGREVLAATPAAAHVIDISTNQEVSRLPTAGEAAAARFVDHGRYVEIAARAGNDVRITRQPLRAAGLRQEACARLTRNLTLAEWHRYLGPAVPYRRTCESLP